MIEETEPQEAPGATPGLEEGQSEEVAQVAPTPEVVDNTAEKLQEAEKRNKDLEFRLTQQGRENAELRRVQSPAQTTEEDIPADAYFSDPVAVTTRIVSKALAESESRQERRRQDGEMRRIVAEQHGIPLDKYDTYYRQLEAAAASGDPWEVHRTVARMYQAENTEEAISQAAKSAVDTATRNARAVTTEGASTQTSPPAKPDSELSIDELRAKLVKQHGELPYE